MKKAFQKMITLSLALMMLFGMMAFASASEADIPVNETQAVAPTADSTEGPVQETPKSDFFAEPTETPTPAPAGEPSGETEPVPSEEPTPSQDPDPEEVEEEETEISEIEVPVIEIPQEVVIDGSIWIDFAYGKGPSFYLGSRIVLESFLSGFEGASSIQITWEYCDNHRDEWQPAPGINNGTFYEFILTEENAHWAWRASVEAN